jgi:hypothetical protein
MLDQPRQNIRQRAARLAGRDKIHINCREDAGKIAQRLGKTAAIDQGLMERVRHLLHARLLEAFFQNGQSLIEGHARLEQMPELLGKDQQLAVRNFQLLRRHG